MKPIIEIDLTPWARGPTTGIGLAALRTFEALQVHDSAFDIRGTSRTAISDARIQKSRWWKFKRPNIQHSFEHRDKFFNLGAQILTVHDCWTLWENPYQSEEYQRSHAPRLMRAIDKATSICTPTEVVRKNLLDWYPDLKDRIFVTPWAPVELAYPGPIESEIASYLKLKRPYILSVGYLEVRKNQSFLVKAMKEVNPQVDLVIVGALGFGGENVKREMSELGSRCYHFSPTDEATLLKLYDSAIAFVAPSLDEGFGMPVLEAMHRGTPVVVSDIPTFREMVSESGIFFDLRAPAKTLAEIINHLASSEEERARWGHQARLRSQLFSWNETARRVLKVYERTLSGISR